MKTNYSYSNASDIDISFNIPQKSKDKNIKDKNSKQKLPEQKIFRINSLIFNDEKDKQEIYTKYDCIYNSKDNSLYLIFNENLNYSKFTKDKLINILDFSNNKGIEIVYILINKNNKDYKSILQDMLFIGFESGKNIPLFNIDGYLYKALKLTINDTKQEIKQINLI